MSQSKTAEIKKESSLSIPNILADFFLKKIDMASLSDDSDLKHKSKRKKSKHKKRKHKKSKHHHRSGSFSSSSESPEVIAKVSVDGGMSSSEEMDIKRLKKIKKRKFQAVSDTVLKSSVSLDSQSEIKAAVQTSSSSKENPAFYGPSLELLLSGVENNSLDSKSVQNNSCSGDANLSKKNLDTTKISPKDDSSENIVSENSDVALPSSSINSHSVVDNNTNTDLGNSTSCTNKNNCVTDSKCKNDCEKESSCKSNKEVTDSKVENDCEKGNSCKSDKNIRPKGGSEESIVKDNKDSDSNNQSLENLNKKVSSSEKNFNSNSANNEASVKDTNHKKNKDKSADVKSRSSKRKHSRSRSRSKSRNRHASPKPKHTRRRSRSLSRDSRSARKKKRHSRSRSRSRDRLRPHDRKRRSYSKSRSRSRSRHGYRRNRRNSHSHSPHRRHSRRRSRSRSRSYLRSRRRSKSRTRRSRSREHRRSLSKSKHAKSRKSRSRSRSKRSKSRSKRSKSRSKRSKSRSRSKSRHKSPSKRKSHSRSNSTEKKSATHKSGKIDQAKVLEMARKNVLKMMASGTLPEGLPVENIKKEQLISMQSGGKSVQELTDFCQRLSQKENEPNNSDNEENGDKNTEDERGFIHHPFKVKEPAMIKLNIKNAVQLPIKTHAQKVAELSSQFPVSSGNQHKKKELEWIPVVPESSKTETKPETTVSTVASAKNAVVPLPEVTTTPILPPPPPPPPPIAISYPCPPPPEVPKVEELPVASVMTLPAAPVQSVVSQMQTAMPCPTIYQMSGEHVMQAYVAPEQQMQYTAISVPSTTFSVPSFPTFSTTPSASVFKPPKKLDISSIVAKRFQAITKLQGNPNDPECLKILQDAQESIQEWVQSQQVPGLFTGSTDAKVLSAAELCGPYNKYHKSRKDFLSQAPPVTSGKGMSLLKKMGWNPGEGLGKNKEGSLEPLVLDIKMDKKGLVSEGENSKKGVSSFIKELQGKHPVSALMELCSKRKWKPPLYTCVIDTGPPHKKLFCFKVEVNGVEYQPVNPSSNKKIAKADSAVLCLQALNVLPKNA